MIQLVCSCVCVSNFTIRFRQCSHFDSQLICCCTVCCISTSVVAASALLVYPASVERISRKTFLILCCLITFIYHIRNDPDPFTYERIEFCHSFSDKNPILMAVISYNVNIASNNILRYFASDDFTSGRNIKLTLIVHSKHNQAFMLQIY